MLPVYDSQFLFVKESENLPNNTNHKWKTVTKALNSGGKFPGGGMDWGTSAHPMLPVIPKNYPKIQGIGSSIFD